MRLNKLAFAFMALFLAGCSKAPVPVNVDLTISAEREAASSDESMSALWNANDCLGIYVSHNHKTGDTQPSTPDNIRYTCSEGEASSTALFITNSPFDLCEGDLITGYLPYSGLKNNSGRNAGAVRTFTLGSQMQNGDNSTAHVRNLDFMTASPVTVSGDMLAEVPDVVVPLKFTHAFAGIRFELKNEFRRSLRIQKVLLESGDQAALTGDYEIDLIAKSVTAVKPVPSVELTFNDAGRTAVNGQLTGYAVVNATTLAAGSELTIYTSAGTFRTLTTSDITLERGHTATVSLALTSGTLVGEETSPSIDNCIGDWRLASFCGKPADMDIYVTLRKDRTFTLYQRSADYMPVRFSGSYTYDAGSCRLSGSYDDGTAWADSYIVEDADGEFMVWLNAVDKSEVSVYKRSGIPESMQ